MPYTASFHNKRMLDALSRAKKGWGKTSPNPMVGAVIVKNGEIVGSGYHHKAGEDHAEVLAIRDAGSAAKGAILYVTLEPCSSYGKTPPCTDAIIKAGISTVVMGSYDPNPKHSGKAVKILEEAGIKVITGIQEQKCKELNEHFFKWITTGRPFVILKMASSLDGKIALKNGESKWITGEKARKRVNKLRQLSDAILIGANTLRKDRPALKVKKIPHWPQPRRIVASNSLTLSQAKKLFRDDTPQPEVVRLQICSDWERFLEKLGRENVLTLLIEGGAELAASALRCGVVDKIEFHIAPFILGGKDSISTIEGINPSSLTDKIPLSNIKILKAGEDLIITAYPSSPGLIPDRNLGSMLLQGDGE